MALRRILGAQRFLVDIGATADIDRAWERNRSSRLTQSRLNRAARLNSAPDAEWRFRLSPSVLKLRPSGRTQDHSYQTLALFANSIGIARSSGPAFWKGRGVWLNSYPRLRGVGPDVIVGL